MRKFAINGRFIVRKQTGQERFAQEIVRNLDKISKKGDLILVVPEYAKAIPNYKNIEIVRYGNMKKLLWEQINFFWYIKKHRMTSINLTTKCPLLSPDIVCLHDACIFDMPNLLTHNLYGKMSYFWHRLIFQIAAWKAKKILTVSFYSKAKLMYFLKIPEERFLVIYNSWQHFKRIQKDDSIFFRLPASIKLKEYFLAVSSLTPQKNFVWIKEVAKNNPDKQFLICGSAEHFTKHGELDLKINNLHFTGYLTDGEIKALMCDCRAFIHPAIYEGFGIPPLEAMSCGAKLILSPLTCLPEIYERSAYYIDPYDYNVDLTAVMSQKIESSERILNKFSWYKEAEKLYNTLKSM